MATQMIGNAQFTYDATTVLLGTRLFNQTFQSSRTRHTMESDDLTLREIITVGSAQKELVGTVRLHDDPDELQDMIDAGLDGTTLTYSPDGGSTTYECILIHASDVTPDVDAPAGLPSNNSPMYQATLTLRATGATTDFSGLAGLP